MRRRETAEFAELGEAGFEPPEVLRVVTVNPAEYLGRTDLMGTVEPGRKADLVVLESNPLERSAISTTSPR